MSLNFLDFEQPIAELEAKIDSLTAVSRQDEKLDINIDEEVHRLREKSVELTRKIFADLGAWQIAQLARHPQRPYTLDYVRLAFDEFDELAGDRAYADDKAIVGGIARLDGRPVMIIGHQKGRETKEKIRRNFGMPAPEGYRKALRLMQMAERFKMPIITFIDTPGLIRAWAQKNAVSLKPLHATCVKCLALAYRLFVPLSVKVVLAARWRLAWAIK